MLHTRSLTTRRNNRPPPTSVAGEPVDGGRRRKDRKTGQLAGADCSNKTYNRYKSYLSTIFKFGIRCGYNTINPVELIKAAPVVVETYEGFHEDQLGLLLTHCPPHTRLIATMLADTGMRHQRRVWRDDSLLDPFRRGSLPPHRRPGRSSEKQSAPHDTNDQTRPGPTA